MRWYVVACGVLLVAAAGQSSALAQGGPIHYFHSADLPPGWVAQNQLFHAPGMPCHVQPVQIRVPDGAQVSVNMHGAFDEPRTGPILLGMMIGPVYQLKVTNIPYHEGEEVYPTVEVINRLYPPPGQELRHPLPIQITLEELEMSLDGRLVTRVVYLEDRDKVLPVRDDPQDQRHFDVAPHQDPLRVADELGRPMAILRMGSRIPDAGDLMAAGQAPVVVFGNAAATDESRINEAAIDRQTESIPRIRLEPRAASRRQPVVPYVTR
jgi:hypothetical protein